MDRDGSRDGASVFRALTPVRSSYLHRAHTPQRPEADLSPRPVPVEQAGYWPCVAVAVVSIDGKGRIAWPHDAAVSNPIVELGAGQALDIRSGPPGEVEHRLDNRRRLHLPLGLLKAVELRPGDRVVVIRQPAGDGFGIVAPDRVGVFRGVG